MEKRKKSLELLDKYLQLNNDADYLRENGDERYKELRVKAKLAFAIWTRFSR